MNAKIYNDHIKDLLNYLIFSGYSVYDMSKILKKIEKKTDLQYKVDSSFREKIKTAISKGPPFHDLKF